jgi:hypothetical protein
MLYNVHIFSRSPHCLILLILLHSTLNLEFIYYTVLSLIRVCTFFFAYCNICVTFPRHGRSHSPWMVGYILFKNVIFFYIVTVSCSLFWYLLSLFLHYMLSSNCYISSYKYILDSCVFVLHSYISQFKSYRVTLFYGYNLLLHIVTFLSCYCLSLPSCINFKSCFLF